MSFHFASIWIDSNCFGNHSNICWPLDQMWNRGEYQWMPMVKILNHISTYQISNLENDTDFDSKSVLFSGSLSAGYLSFPWGIFFAAKALSLAINMERCSSVPWDPRFPVFPHCTQIMWRPTFISTHSNYVTPDPTGIKGIGDAGSTADLRMLWSAIVCLGLGLL